MQMTIQLSTPSTHMLAHDQLWFSPRESDSSGICEHMEWMWCAYTCVGMGLYIGRDPRKMSDIFLKSFSPIVFETGSLTEAKACPFN